MAKKDSEIEDGAADDDAPKPKKWSGKRIVMIVLPVLLLLGGGGFAAMTFLGGDKTEETADAHGGGKDAAEGGAESGEVVFVAVPELLVNLKSSNRKNAYLKLTIELEVSGQETADEVGVMMPRILDNFQVYLRELRIEDLSGSGGMFRLKEELMRRINTAVAPLRVDDVLFKEMLVQ